MGSDNVMIRLKDEDRAALDELKALIGTKDLVGMDAHTFRVAVHIARNAMHNFIGPNYQVQILKRSAYNRYLKIFKEVQVGESDDES